MEQQLYREHPIKLIGAGDNSTQAVPNNRFWRAAVTFIGVTPNRTQARKHVWEARCHLPPLLNIQPQVYHCRNLYFL